MESYHYIFLKMKNVPAQEGKLQLAENKKGKIKNPRVIYNSRIFIILVLYTFFIKRFANEKKYV